MLNTINYSSATNDVKYEMFSSTTNTLKEKADAWAVCGFVALDNNENIIGFLIYTVLNIALMVTN